MSSITVSLAMSATPTAAAANACVSPTTPLQACNTDGSRIYIKHPERFARKWERFCRAGAKKLMVIADFDQTLTRFYDDDGDHVNSCHGVLMTSRVLDPVICDHERDLVDTFHPLTFTPTMTIEERTAHMRSWWVRAHDVLVDYKVTRAQVTAAVSQAGVLFRPGFHDVVQLLATANVPLLIFSAGIYDVIHEVLQQEFTKRGQKAPPSNMHVVSNMMDFDTDDVLQGFRGNLIHSMNKNASVLEGTEFGRQCHMEERHNILLLGDSLGDVNMANGMQFADDEIIRIGFLNHSVEERRDQYMDAFDVVLTDDATLDVVHELLRQLHLSNQ
ncbi:TPA: hypothetical protein N0F65_003466 [Lagenidium giganteum]|uniref:5'-nucleotidase n=1 Tax=Lagenidium giganteum TaxID=4803 RepID=A0AAV2YN48_9STRA|nr:TPA: hypothetical protein N0F65_003466 [Lagenidium giganteum]